MQIRSAVAFCYFAIAFFLLSSPTWSQARSDGTAVPNEIELLIREQRFEEALALAETQVKATEGRAQDNATALVDLAQVYAIQGRNKEAAEYIRRALPIWEKEPGPDSRIVGVMTGALANQLFLFGHTEEAEPLFRRALSILGRLDPNGNETLVLSFQFSRLLTSMNRLSEAMQTGERALELAQKILPPHFPGLAQYVANLSRIYQLQGRLPEAEALGVRALALFEQALPKGHPEITTARNNLASIYQDEYRMEDAERLFQLVLAEREAAQPQDKRELANGLHNLGAFFVRRARPRLGEPLLGRALVLRQEVASPSDVAQTLAFLAEAFAATDRWVDAERQYRRALEILEAALPRDDAAIGGLLGSIGQFYVSEARLRDAETYYRRGLSLQERVFGRGHPTTETTRLGLAAVMVASGKFDEADTELRIASRVIEQKFGPQAPILATVYLITAASRHKQGRLNDTEEPYKHAIEIFAKAMPQGSFEEAVIRTLLAALYLNQGRPSDAESMLNWSITHLERLQPDHPLATMARGAMSEVRLQQRKYSEALALARRAAASLQQRRVEIAAALPALSLGVAGQAAGFHIQHAITAFHAQTAGQGTEEDLRNESFVAVQMAGDTQASLAVERMTARFATGNPTLSRMIRERQDAERERDSAEAQLTAALALPVDARRTKEARLHALLQRLAARIGDATQRVQAEFPQYEALVHPQPLSISEAASLLSPNEVLVQFAFVLREGLVIAVGADGKSRWARIAFGEKAVAEWRDVLRCGLDQTAWLGAGATRCSDLLHVHRPADDDPLPFDVGRAHNMYEALFGPIADMIKGKHLIVVPAAALTNLPFSVLVIEPPQVRIPKTFDEYKKIVWLGTHQPITVLPSVASLGALRKYATPSHAVKAYLGVGNPWLEGDQSDAALRNYYEQRAKVARAKRCGTASPPQRALTKSAPAAFASIFRGTQANVEAVRRWPPLPETADEVCTVGARLRAGAGDILIGSDATESHLKEMSALGGLANYHVVHFATHGALAGQVQGASEPGLILTPPHQGAADAKTLERDDGFLTASEIANLKLDADWVILSACNTAGSSGESDSGGAEALSGMARAFFYAGARALLVSHWEVGSDAAVKLTTRAFAELAAHPRMGRAEAMEISMRELISTGTQEDAHPSTWAPFVVVGEGAGIGY
jgi:CHAT domain-containing protein/tetratricopeptide (TPR) repeat protein